MSNSTQPTNEDEPYYMVSFLYPYLDYDGANFGWATIDYYASAGTRQRVASMRKDFQTHREAFEFVEKYYDLDLVAVVEQRDSMVDKVLVGEHGHRTISQAIKFWILWYKSPNWFELTPTEFMGEFFGKGSKKNAGDMLKEFDEIKIDEKYGTFGRALITGETYK